MSLKARSANFSAGRVYPDYFSASRPVSLDGSGLALRHKSGKKIEKVRPKKLVDHLFGC